jgi:hypothetical protein
MQGVATRIARAVNQAMSRKRGKVFSDRYHVHVLSTPKETRAAVAYVLENFRRHCEKAGRPISSRFVDPHTSAALERSALPTPRFWFLTNQDSAEGPP